MGLKKLSRKMQSNPTGSPRIEESPKLKKGAFKEMPVPESQDTQTVEKILNEIKKSIDSK